MPWQDSVSAPFSRLSIVSRVPSASGVYGVFHGECCVLIGHTWNLKAHLLELISTISATDVLTIRYELWPEDEAAHRSETLKRELTSPATPARITLADDQPSGLSFWTGGSDGADSGSPEA